MHNIVHDESKNFARVDKHTSLQMLLLDVLGLTLIIQGLGQLTTKPLQQFLHYFILF